MRIQVGLLPIALLLANAALAQDRAIPVVRVKVEDPQWMFLMDGEGGVRYEQAGGSQNIGGGVRQAWIREVLPAQRVVTLSGSACSPWRSTAWLFQFKCQPETYALKQTARFADEHGKQLLDQSTLQGKDLVYHRPVPGSSHSALLNRLCVDAANEAPPPVKIRTISVDEAVRRQREAKGAAQGAQPAEARETAPTIREQR